MGVHCIELLFFANENYFLHKGKRYGSHYLDLIKASYRDTWEIIKLEKIDSSINMIRPIKDCL